MPGPWEKYGAPSVVNANPMFPGQMIGQQQTNARQAAELPYVGPKAAADTRKAVADANIADANSRNAAELADAQARKAEAEAKTAEIGLKRNPALDPAVRKSAIDAYGTAQTLRGIVSDLSEKFQQGPGATSGLAGLSDYFPSTANQRFDRAGNAARGIVGTALGFTGGQLNTPREAEQAVGPYLPQSSDRDAVALDKIKQLSALADQAERKAIATLGGRPDVNGNIKPVEQMDASSRLVSTADPQEAVQTSTSTKSINDPYLQAVGRRVGSMIASDVPDDKIKSYLSGVGIDPSSTSLGSALRYRQTPDFKAWRKANPGKSYPIDSSFYAKDVPLTGLQSVMSGAAQSGLGALAINAANGVSAGHLADMSPQADLGLQAVRDAHPMMSILGDAAGQGLAQAGMPIGGKFAPLIKDALYGAAGTDGTAAGTGANILATVGGGALGRRLGDVARIAGRGINPSSSLAYLNGAQVPMTIGAIARGTNSVTGRAIGGVEDRLAGLPGYDAIINTARQRSMEGFDRAAFKQAGGSGATGAAGVADLADKVDNAYSFLDGAQIPLDARYAGTNAGIRSELPMLPNYGPQVGKVMDQIDRGSANGMLTGRGWQDALRLARSSASSIKGKEFADGAAEKLGDVQDNLAGLAARQGPEGASQALQSANQLYGNYRTIGNALDNGPAVARGEIFGPGRLDAAARASARKFGGQNASMAGDRPFYDLTKAGMDVLPNQVPDSGTAGRAMLMSMLYGGGLGGVGAGLGAIGGGDQADGAKTGGEIGLGTALALLGPYSKVGQKAIQATLLGERPAVLKAIADYLGNKPANAAQRGLQGLAGKRGQSALGGATLRDMLIYPQLPQQ